MFTRDKKPKTQNTSTTEKNKDLFIQPKLSFGKSGDSHEIEADKMAEKVVNKPTEAKKIQKKEGEEDVQAKPLASEATSVLQRKESSEEEPVQKMAEEEALQSKEEEVVQSKEEEEVQAKKCEDCEKEKVQKMEEEAIQSKQNEEVQSKESAKKSTKQTTSFESKLRRGSGGQKLDKKVRNEMEAGFGSSFNHIKIHNDSEAENMSESIGAQAFTHGNDIYFNKGKYNPNSKEGKTLLAHELTHTIQQKGMVQKQIQRSLVTNPPSCSNASSLPLSYTDIAVRRGTHYTEVFERPTSGKVNVFVKASETSDNCHIDNTYGVALWQCHIIGDESIESQRVKMFREDDGISYRFNLPTESWNTYNKFYLRLYFTCSASVTISVN